MTPFRAPLTLSALLVATLAGCAGTGASGPGPDSGPAGGRDPGAPADSGASTDSGAPGGLSPAEVEAFEALYRARTDSARQHFTPADVHFVSGMIGHHSQALVMSALAPTHGASPTIRTLTARIINAQRDEIALMERWLRDRGQPVPEVMISGLEMMIHGADHDMMMPGMLSPEQLRQLDAARGAEFDRLFLTLMIQHHQGAVTMVHELFATDGAGQDEAVFKLASDIQVDQKTEIARMELMLEAMNGDARPARSDARTP